MFVELVGGASVEKEEEEEEEEKEEEVNRISLKKNVARGQFIHKLGSKNNSHYLQLKITYVNKENAQLL